MPHKIERLGINDYDECLRFLKLSFNKYDHQLDFEKELPKVFRPIKEQMECNYVIRENGEIAALVGIYPMELVIGKRKIQCACIGNVATHPEHRGKGLMQELFTFCVNEADRRNIQMERLGGLRQRYNRFGFEKSGCAVRYDWTSYNGKMLKASAKVPKFTFSPISEDTPEWLEKAAALYRENRCRVERIDTETFLCVLKAHYCAPYAILDCKGGFAGYLTAASKSDVNELFAVDPAQTEAILTSLCEENKTERISVYCTVWDREPRYISRFAENFISFSPSMFRIHDFYAVAGALFEYKNDLGCLPDGELRIKVDGCGTLLFKVKDGEAKVEKSEESGDITLDTLSATRLIFGNLPPETVTSADRKTMGLINQWFPLPLSWSKQDNV